jgi:hypothetical protein
VIPASAGDSACKALPDCSKNKEVLPVFPAGQGPAAGWLEYPQCAKLNFILLYIKAT